MGRPERQEEPWRDTGVEILGPAVAHAEVAFAEIWQLAGGRPFVPVLDAGDRPRGRVALRLIPTEPFTANLLRLDLLVSSLARRSLWITDAYFIGTGPYLESLRRAARDGVDVRLLLPRDSDVGWTVPVSRSLYRPLLEAGVRIFEWNGTMVHAKTAIADSRWARIGSTNLNLNSWIGNWEMDVAVEDETVAATLGSHFVEDLERSTEIVLATRRARTRVPPGLRRASPRRVIRTMTGVGRSLGAAVTGNRPLEDFEVGPVAGAGILLSLMGAVAFLLPSLVSWLLAAACGWVALTFFVEAWSIWRRR
jgi:phosphatidylserine/phosphatidylglycerophosphate/cardiolipin synthase-like enzyme